MAKMVPVIESTIINLAVISPRQQLEEIFRPLEMKMAELFKKIENVNQEIKAQTRNNQLKGSILFLNGIGILVITVWFAMDAILPVGIMGGIATGLFWASGYHCCTEMVSAIDTSFQSLIIDLLKAWDFSDEDLTPLKHNFIIIKTLLEENPGLQFSLSPSQQMVLKVHEIISQRTSMAQCLEKLEEVQSMGLVEKIFDRTDGEMKPRYWKEAISISTVGKDLAPLVAQYL